MSLVKRATWVIERNLDQDLTLGQIADACAVSSYHLSHAYAERIGMPIMEYIRGRRLSIAAEKLAGGWSDILELALNSGYGSHEAFSRAFKTRFGLTPEGLRRQGGVAELSLQAPLDMTLGHLKHLEQPVVRQMRDQTYCSISGHFSLSEMQGIPELWRNFMRRCSELDPPMKSPPIGVMGLVAEDGSFVYGCAAPIGSKETPLPGLKKLRIASRRYAVFKHSGHISAIRGTYAQIWDGALVDRGWTMAPYASLEVHPPEFDTRSGDGGVEIWVPILDMAPALPITNKS